MGNSKNDAPDPPDYSDLIAASTAQANKNFQLGTEQLAWAKEQYGKDSVIAKKVIDAGLARQSENDANARKDRQRYEGVFQPLEDQLVSDANTYNSEGKREQAAGAAMGAVGESFEQSRRAAQQQLESFGVDPSSTRFASLDAGSRIAQAAAAAAAGNTARGEVEDKGRSLRSEALQIGLTYPGNIATTNSTSLQSGNQAANTGLATTASGANTMGTSTQYGALGNGALGVAGNLTSQQYQDAMAKYQAGQQSSSGIGSALGGIAGIAGMFLEDGGTVPDHASPTMGKAIDDVPARLTAGEFVIPKDVLSWKGEEFFQKLIEGSRKSKPGAPAQPQRGAIPAEAPTFRSRSAIPMAA